MSASEREPTTVLLDGEYQIKEVLGDEESCWALQCWNAAMLQWDEIALRPTARACQIAYERVCDGETVPHQS